MYSTSNFSVVALLIAGVLAAIALMSASVRRPSESEMRGALEQALDSFVTPGAVMCGVVPKRASRAEAINCIQSSISQKSAFVAAFQEQGVDSDVWSGLVGDANGELRWLLLDSSPSGKPQARAEYFATSRHCSSPHFAQSGNGAVSCERYEKP